jgi:hypothetical protein
VHPPEWCDDGSTFVKSSWLATLNRRFDVTRSSDSIPPIARPPRPPTASLSMPCLRRRASSGRFALVRFCLTATLALATLTGGASRETLADEKPATVDYAKQIKPLLRERCWSCHGVLKQEAGLRLDTAAFATKGGDSGAAVVAGKLEQSLLIERVTSKDDSTRMPPEGKPLTAEQVELLSAWIRAGAPAPSDEAPETDPRQHWSFQVVKRPVVPKVKNEAWVRTPIDAFISAGHESHGVSPVPAAALPRLLRRVTVDLTGLPPTREDLHAFEADVAQRGADVAYEAVVDRLLGSPQYGERWARHWMDVWRYSDWYGRRLNNDVRNSYGQIWRWRDWIVRSLNDDKGYDRMVVEMLAADEVTPEDDETIVATGYIVRNWYSLNYNTWMKDLVEHTGKAFLGLRINCAHCHDHKYDPITQEEYFKFRAFFEPIELRHDRVAGDADPGPFKKYVYAGSTNPLKSGMIRIFDEKLDAKTEFYTQGDARNVVKDRIIPPGVPKILGGKPLDIQPVSLPSVAWNPARKVFIQTEERAKRTAAIATVESEVTAARNGFEAGRPAAEAALKKSEDALAEAKLLDGENKTSAALAGTQSLHLDATTGRRTLSNLLPSLPEVNQPAVASFLVRILKDAHFNVQFALDIAGGATGGWVGFEKGKILTYKPGGFEQIEAGKYDVAAGPPTLAVTCQLDVEKNQFLLTVVDQSSSAKLVDALPAALNGWKGLRNGKQGMFVDARTGAEVLLDDVVLRPVEGKPWYASDFEPPKFGLGRDAVGIEGWVAHAQAVAPATSQVVQSLSTSPAVKAAEQQMIAARGGLESLRVGLTAAEARLAAARADLVSLEARIAADAAQGEPPAANAADLAKTAAAAEREHGLLNAQAGLAAAEKAAAEADARPATDAKRGEAIQAATTQKTAAKAAMAKAQSNAALTDSNYTPLSPLYPKQSTGRRTALAKWIADRDNPMTARVAVNHIWMRHFGRPLVESVVDFGRSGKTPSHPELLDWLSVELMEGQGSRDEGLVTEKRGRWHMKPLHRLIVLSNTYRLGSDSNPPPPTATTDNALSVTRPSSLDPRPSTDPDNHWYWRFDPRRVEGEVLRDSVLSASGQLDSTMGGPQIDAGQADASRRRSLYLETHAEGGGHAVFLSIFDAPDVCDCYRRSGSVMPQQALALANGSAPVSHAKPLAQRLWDDAKSAAAKESAEASEERLSNAFVTAVFEQLLTRAPTEKESAACVTFLKRQAALSPMEGAVRARESLVRTMFNHTEFQTLP